MFHGLGGSAESGYMIRLARIFCIFGWIVVRCNHRGCGSHSSESKGFYHSGSTSDLLQAVGKIDQLLPDLNMITIGFSLSGTILLNTLGKRHEACSEFKNWKGAIAVCAPID